MATCFWVIGGEYTDCAFDRIVDGTRRVYGPYDTYPKAREVWERESLATRSQALMRFTIARESA